MNQSLNIRLHPIVVGETENRQPLQFLFQIFISGYGLGNDVLDMEALVGQPERFLIRRPGLSALSPPFAFEINYWK